MNTDHRLKHRTPSLHIFALCLTGFDKNFVKWHTVTYCGVVVCRRHKVHRGKIRWS